MTLLSLHQELGASGSLFIFTEDHHLALKLITPTERKFLINQFLFLYHNHIEAHPNSLLNSLLGAFTINIPGLSPLDIIVFPSLVDDSVERFYDLKGSTYNRNSRKAEEIHFKGPYKDSDFMMQRPGLLINRETRKTVLSAIKLDAKFLMENEIMDYSLLVCECKEENERTYPNLDFTTWYRFGIIDYLGKYSFKRKAEYYAKLLRLGKRIKLCSVVNPRSYHNRFLKFLTESVFTSQ